MLFASPLFLFAFLPFTLIGYFLLPKIAQNIFLLAASLFFFAWGDFEHMLFFLLLIGINYAAAVTIEKYRQFSRIILIASIIANVGFLFYYKYIIFFLELLNKVLLQLHLPSVQMPALVLPLGISFVTFRAVSYIVDVFQKKVPAEKNIFHFALYMTFFPHLIAGPIVRYLDIKEELKNRHITPASISYGISRFAVGLGKKVLIANNLGRVTDVIMQLPPGDLNAAFVWLAMISYALQIYYDFSGYSDMAIGLARMFGFTFQENFNYPYISRSITEFWRRWHISLSSWFRDYVYIPLGGSRLGPTRTSLIILVVFLLTGFWHGASFHYIIWGLYFGIFLAIEKAYSTQLKKLGAPFQHAYSLTIIFFGWILFRADSLHYAAALLKIMFGFHSTPWTVASIMPFLTYKYIAIFIVACIGTMPVVPALYNRLKHIYQLRYITLALTTCILIYAISQLAGDTYSPFIYFRF
ncbi:MAG: hypothetical protein RI947_1182 [Candidatus Parcubacteria bacterium]|jgi:alginate O-acetyltransferase complex protein AlgI